MEPELDVQSKSELIRGVRSKCRMSVFTHCEIWFFVMAKQEIFSLLATIRMTSQWPCVVLFVANSPLRLWLYLTVAITLWTMRVWTTNKRRLWKSLARRTIARRRRRLDLAGKCRNRFWSTCYRCESGVRIAGVVGKAWFSTANRTMQSVNSNRRYFHACLLYLLYFTIFRFWLTLVHPVSLFSVFFPFLYCSVCVLSLGVILFF
jgi:hypothetical protein